MIDFPASPTDGQVFSAANGVVYKWSATYSSWLAQSAPPVIGGVGEVTVTAAGYAMTNSVSDRIAFATLVVGNAGLWWSTSTNRYTPPAGKYFLIFTGNVQAPVGGNGTATIFLRKNGAQVGGGVSGSGSASFTIPLTLGQYVDANGTDYFEWYSYAAVANMQFQGGTFSAFPLTGIQGPTGGAPGSVVGDFFARHSTTMALGAVAILPINTVLVGNSGGYYSLSTFRYTPPAGRYRIYCFGTFYSAGTAASNQIQLRKNGSTTPIAFTNVTVGGGWEEVAAIDMLIDANGSDYYEVWGLSGNAATLSNVTFSSFPTQGMVGPPGPAGPVGSIGQMIRGGFTGGSSLPVSAWTTLALNAATTNDTGVAQVGNTWTPPAGRWEVTWSLACTGSAGGVLLAGYSLNGAAPLVYGGGTCISNGADVFVQGSDVIDFNGSTALSFQHFFTAATNGATRPSWWTAIKVK